MRPTRRVRRVLGLLAAVLASVWLVGTAVYAATATPDFGLSALPANQSVAVGSSVNYAITVTGSNGFTGSVALSTGTLPTGLTAGFSVTAVKLSASTTSATSSLTLSAASTMKPGSYTVTITGTSGTGKTAVTHSTTVGLSVTSGSSGSFSLSASPSTLALVPGSQGTSTIGISRSSGFTGSVSLSVFSGLPSGATAAFSPNPTTGTSSTLTLVLGSSTPTGSYSLSVAGISPGSASYTALQLTVQTPMPFSISGSLSGTGTALAPGLSKQPLDLTLTNPNPVSLNVTSLTVTVSGTSATACDASNFTVTPFSGNYSLLTVPAGASATLSKLGVATSAMPLLQFLDKPTVNQGACKAVTVNLAYTGTGQGN